jgi:hypothetical protein
MVCLESPLKTVQFRKKNDRIWVKIENNMQFGAKIFKKEE